MKTSLITKKVLDYQKTHEKKTELIQNIASYIYSCHIVNNYLTADQKSEFLCFFYKEIEHTVEKFSYNGKPFEFYLGTILKWRIKSYLHQVTIDRQISHTLQDAHFIQCERIDYKDYFSKKEFEIHKRISGILLTEIDRSRLLYLFFKEYFIADQRYLPYISKMTGYQEEWILRQIEKLRGILENRLKRFRMLSEKRNRTYFQLYQIEKKKYNAAMRENTDLMTVKIKILEKRLHTTNKEIAKFSIRPTHREISDITGIPKGTIDSGFYYFKKHCRKIMDESEKAA